MQCITVDSQKCYLLTFISSFLSYGQRHYQTLRTHSNTSHNENCNVTELHRATSDGYHESLKIRKESATCYCFPPVLRRSEPDHETTLQAQEIGKELSDLARKLLVR